jgi:DNA processing protein
VLDVRDVLEGLNLHLAPQQMEMRELLPENETEARLLAALTATGEPLHIDELCRATGVAIAEVSGTMVMLELKGLVRLMGPMTYARA